MKKFISVLAAFVVAMTMVAQNGSSESKKKAEITFDEASYDFGSIREELGSVSHTFRFRNTGDTAVRVTKVRTSCGCTQGKTSHEDVFPGGEGVVEVRYSTSGRPGGFTKTITVTSTAGSQQLIIKGYVIPKGQKLETIFPHKLGDLRFKTLTLDFGEVTKGKDKVMKFEVANPNQEPVTITYTELPKYIRATPVTIPADGRGFMTFVYDGAKSNEWGHDDFDVEFTTKKGIESCELKCVANLVEEFTDAQRANAPILSMPSSIDFGDVVSGKKTTKVITVANTGSSNLVIHKVDDPDGVDFVAPKTVKAGKSKTIKVTIDPSDVKSAQRNEKIATIISNDPHHSVKQIRVTFNVK